MIGTLSLLRGRLYATVILHRSETAQVTKCERNWRHKNGCAESNTWIQLSLISNDWYVVFVERSIVCYCDFARCIVFVERSFRTATTVILCRRKHAIEQ